MILYTCNLRRHCVVTLSWNDESASLWHGLDTHHKNTQMIVMRCSASAFKIINDAMVPWYTTMPYRYSAMQLCSSESLVDQRFACKCNKPVTHTGTTQIIPWLITKHIIRNLLTIQCIVHVQHHVWSWWTGAITTGEINQINAWEMRCVQTTRLWKAVKHKYYTLYM